MHVSYTTTARTTDGIRTISIFWHTLLTSWYKSLAAFFRRLPIPVFLVLIRHRWTPKRKNRHKEEEHILWDGHERVIVTGIVTVDFLMYWNTLPLKKGISMKWTKSAIHGGASGIYSMCREASLNWHRRTYLYIHYKSSEASSLSFMWSRNLQRIESVNWVNDKTIIPICFNVSRIVHYLLMKFQNEVWCCLNDATWDFYAVDAVVCFLLGSTICSGSLTRHLHDNETGDKRFWCLVRTPFVPFLLCLAEYSSS